MVDVIVWHQRPDTNYRTAAYFKRHIKVEEYDPSKPLPDRGSAYAYQIGKGVKHWVDDIYRLEAEILSLSGMNYFGMPKEIEGILYCEDDHGHLWMLEQGVDTIEPVEKGVITITHSKPPKKYPSDTQGDW